jgi:hypothetical protein
MNQDFRDLLAEFNAAGVEFLVVGAHALAAHGLVRATKDLDNKRAAAREQDLLDVKWLEKTKPNE